MPRENTTNLQLIKPDRLEQYNIDHFNSNMQKIDDFAGLTPPRALTADKLTTGRNINGVYFDGTSDIELERGFARNIGEIVTSTIPLIDAGLHLLDGALIQYGSYSAFIDYMAGLFITNPELFCAESEWQESITAHGVCGKFVYDNENNTLRLPKITGFIEGTKNPEELGNIVEAGLPNITGSSKELIVAGGFFNDGALRGSFYRGNVNSGSSFEIGNFNLDASRSNSIYGASTTVQPQSVKVLYYIVIATSTKTDIQVNIDEIVTDLNSKADKDLKNITTTGKELITSLCVPDYDNGILGAALNTSKTVTQDVLVTAVGNGDAAYTSTNFYLRNPDGLYIAVNKTGTTTEKINYISGNSGNAIHTVIPVTAIVPKGYTYSIDTNIPLGALLIKEYPLKGAN